MKKNRIEKDVTIKKDFRKIPKTIEKRTSPFLYSFFNGLKKVCSKSGTEKRCKRYEFSFIK